MNARQRINGLVAHCAAFPLGIKDGGVAILGKYHGHLVCEHADGSFGELAQAVLRLNMIGNQSSTRSHFCGYSVESRTEQRASPSNERCWTSRNAWR
jgi:hypothetical protein